MSRKDNRYSQGDIVWLDQPFEMIAIMAKYFELAGKRYPAIVLGQRTVVRRSELEQVGTACRSKKKRRI